MERTTTREKGRAVRLWLLASALALVAVVALGTSPDGAGACERMSLNGTIRKCTVTENFSQCIRDSEDAYWQCRRRHPGFIGAIRCSLANNIDHLGCVLESGAFGAARGFRSTFA